MKTPTITIRQERLHEIREDNNLRSVGQMADELGIARPHMYQMLNGTRGIGTAFIVRMYTRFGEPFTTATKNPLYQIEGEGEDLL